MIMGDERSPLIVGEGQPQTIHPSPQGDVSRSRRRMKLACCAILLTEVLERIAFYGLVGNLVLFLNRNPLDWMSYNAANALFVFTGISYMTSIVGGWLADAKIGKFKTIIFSFIVYLGGYAFFPNLSYPHILNANDGTNVVPAWCGTPPRNSTAGPTKAPKEGKMPGEEQCAWAVYLALCIIGIGNGFIKANIAPFGADQVKHEGPQVMLGFFNWFYWAINIGCLISLGGLGFLQQEFSFFWGYIAPCISLLLAMIVFAMGGAAYVRKPPGGSVLGSICAILREACRKRKRRHSSNGSAAVDTASLSVPSTTFLDMAKVRHGGSFHEAVVDDVKSLGKILCVFIALVPYWMVYYQMETTFVVQGLHMRLGFLANATAEAKNHFHLPAAWLSLFDIIFLLILIPIMDRIIYPRLDRAGYHMTLRVRIAIGMVFSFLAVSAAGGLEVYRLNAYHSNETFHQQIAGTTYKAANVSIFLQVPQYALIGISEVFASVAGLEFAYSSAPASMKGIIMGLFWFFSGIGSMLGTASMYLFRGVWFFDWDNGDINCRIYSPTAPRHLIASCHLDYYYFFLAGLQLIGLVVFILVAVKLDIGHTQWPPRHSRDKLSPASSIENSGSPTRHVQRDKQFGQRIT